MNRASFIKSLSLIGLSPRVIMEINNMPKFDSDIVWCKYCRVPNSLVDDTKAFESFIYNAFSEVNFKNAFHLYYGFCEDDFVRNITTVIIRQQVSDLKTKPRLDGID